MEDHVKGITIALVLISMAAIGTAFASSAKNRNAGKEIGRLKGQVQQLSQTKNVLEQDLAQVKARYEEQASLGSNLKEALAQEQLKNRTLAEELQKQQEQKGQDVKVNTPPAPVAAPVTTQQANGSKKTGGQNFSSGKSR